MTLIALVVVVLGTYVPLMHAASGGSRIARALGALEGLLFVAGTSFSGLLALILLGLKCDESCDENLTPEARWGEWWHTLDAWQWKAQFGLAAAAFVAAVATVALPLTGKHRAAIVAVVLGVAVFCAWALLVAPLGDQFGI